MLKITFTIFFLLPILAHAKVKNVIFMIGDGMGPQQISLLQMYANHAPNSIYRNKKTAFEKMSNNSMGIHLPQAYGEIVIDSAASATHMATGHVSRPGMIGMNKDAKSVVTILELAKKAGLSTGLITETRMTHATPASYAAHVISRKNEALIAEQMVATQPDIMFGGGLKSFIPMNAAATNLDFYKKWRKRIPRRISFASTKRKDQKDILTVAEKNGYQLVFDKKSMQESKSDKILGLFTSDAMPDGIWFSVNDKSYKRDIPNIPEMTQKALDVLSKNKKGFFLMVEGGQIDWAAHANDTATMLHNMIHFEKTIDLVLKWAAKRKDTLVIVTGDHETGSFGFSYIRRKSPYIIKVKGKEYVQNVKFGSYDLLDKLYNQKASYGSIYSEYEKIPEKKRSAKKFRKIFNKYSEFKLSKKDAKRAIKTKNGWPVIDEFNEFYVKPFLARSAVIARILSAQHQIVWGTGGHTATAIPVYTQGPQSITNKFQGFYNNTKLFDLTKEALGL